MIMLSVNPPYAGWLVDGLKIVEWRKKPLPAGKAFVYETKKNGGIGKIIGEVEIFGTIKYTEKEFSIYSKTLVADSKIALDDLRKYAGGKDVFANCVKKPVRYTYPQPLSDFRRPCDQFIHCLSCERGKIGDLSCKGQITRPPQSWCYVEDMSK